MPLLKLK